VITLTPTSVVVVVPPVLPQIRMAPPAPRTTVLVPVLGPKGDKGDPGAVDDMAAVQGMIDGSIATHVQAAEPHPAYDEMPSLRLVFENGLI
jgi:hypothetical protein